MENTPNFLDVLEEKLNELIEKGVITEEQARDGIQIDESWLYTSNIPRKDIINAMVQIMIDNDEEYMDSCEKENKDPYKPRSIIISKNNYGAKINVNGNDENCFRYLITNSQYDKLDWLQITSEEFLEQVYLRFTRRIAWDYTKGAGEDVKLLDVKNNFLNSIDEQTRMALEKSLKDGQRLGLNELAENLVKYYEYLLNEEKESSKLIVDDAGFRNRENDARTGIKGTSSGTSGTKISDEISFEVRDETLKSLKPFRIVRFYKPAKNADEEIIPADLVYIYKCSQRDGFILMDEPYSSNESARCVYLTEEKIKDFVIPGQQMDGQFWREVSRHFVDMGEQEFRDEEATAAFYHTDENNYINTIIHIILDTDNIPKEQGIAVGARVKRVRDKLFNGVKTPNIKSVVERSIASGEISVDELEDVKEFFIDMPPEKATGR